ncbi:MAG: carboxypeptidase-like regulatory domain-containing protein, partial [Prolixibacteraceae bacterium]|nr:carboxypeptidase-like regulatory domain-containing protein [Prolixibacteraceae bacterium]
TGNVYDEKTNEPIPFVNIWFKGTNQGTISDMNGDFKLPLVKKDTLCFSSVGYFQKEIKIENGTKMPISVSLIENVKELGEVQVKPEISRAKELFEQILNHKNENKENIKRVNEYKILETKTVYVAVDTFSKIIRSLGNLDDVTIESDNQKLRFSPVYLSEQARIISNDSVNVVYSKKDGIFPRLNQTIESMIVDKVVVDLDFYKDQIYIMDRGFISPLNNSALLHYNLYLDDSITIDNNQYYNFSFAPKNKYDPFFTGHFTIEDGSFALTAIDVYINLKANLNFVNGFKGQVSYKKLPDGNWFYNSQNIGVNLSLTSNKDSASNYSSKRIDNIEKGNWLINKYIQYSASEGLNGIKAGEWKQRPEFAFDSSLANAYSRVDKIKEHEVVKGIDKIGGMVLTSYFNKGIIDIGPVYDIYSTNTIEGERIAIPIRTSEKMFKYFSIGGFVGYGTRNSEFKYGTNLVYQPQTMDKFILRFNYSNDYNLVSQEKFLRFIKYNPNSKGTGNFISLFTSREENPYLKEEESFEIRIEYNALNGNHLEVSPYLLSSTNTQAVRFIRNNTEYEHYKNYGVLMDLRFAFGQPYDKFYFDRIYYIGNIPVVHMSFDIGQTLLPGQKIKNAGLYAQFHSSVQGRLTRGQVFMNYMLNGGYLMGDAPYDLLDQPVGSMSLGYSKDRFNLLHFASFAHNLYTNAHLYVNGGGVLLNRVPLVRKLKLYEIVSFKGHIGELNNSYQPVFDLPSYYSKESNKPYAEIGFGITNIFKVLRIEYVRQLTNTYVGSGFADKGGIRFRAEMSF